MKAAACVRALVLTASGGIALAQELEPRAFSNSPVGMQFFVAGFGESRGKVNLDPALPIDNLGVESDFGLVAWACTMGIAGKSAKFDVVLPYSTLDAHGLVFGEPRTRHVSGFGDPALRFSMNFIGAPALTMEELPATSRTSLSVAVFASGFRWGSMMRGA